MNCTVGPVIGEVTDTTARILLECDADGRLDLDLESDDGKHVHTNSQILMKGRPKVYKFDKLQPGKRYSVTTKMTKLVKSKFKTLPAGGFTLERIQSAERWPRFGFISGNNFYAANKQKKIRRDACLWQDLASSINKFDYLLHLGDNTYVDANKRTGPDNKWQVALTYIAVDGEFFEHKWEGRKEEIREIFRAAYRDTWGSKPTRKVLANVPNLMVYAENDIARNWMSQDPQKRSVDWFIAMQVYYVLGEYQTQLYKDFFDVRMDDMGHHFHALGDIGFYFQDTVGFKTLDKASGNQAMLGNKQWEELMDALNGVFEKTKFLFVLMPRPVFVLSQEETTRLASSDATFRNMWMNEPYISEATEFLNAIFTWKLGGSRDVLLVGGSGSQGGWTNIIIQNRGESGVPSSSLTQLTTGPTAADPLPIKVPTELVTTTMRSRHDGTYSFKHFGWTKHRNYAVVEMIKDSNENATYIGHLVESSPTFTDRRASFDARFGADNYRELRICDDCCIL